MNYYLAIDIGASSGRHILSYVENDKIFLEEIYRFDNIQIHTNGHDCWNVEYLFKEILNGLKECKKQDKIPVSMAIDTWAVDYVLLDENDDIIGNSVAYRDARTSGIDEEVYSLIPNETLYERTGIQKQIFNTIYQLMAQKKESSEDFVKAQNFLMIPEYFNFLLTGVKMNEYTNATSTNLVNALSNDWDFCIIEKLGLPKNIFGKLHMPTEIVGDFSSEIQKELGFNTKVILPATHDTGSAFLAVPAIDDNSVYLSSGTWSLMGVENTEAITSECSRIQNFTNEGGAWYRYRYLKNIMGLWMIQSIRRELNGVSYVENKENLKFAETVKKYSFDDLVNEAKKTKDYSVIIDVDDVKFLSPKSMIEAIKEYCKENELPVPNTVGEIMQCVYSSLASKYAKTVKSLEKLTDKTYASINIVGGGCKDDYLNELTAKYTGLTVHAGPVEGTSLGNLIVQMIANKEFENLENARKAIRNSFEIITINQKGK